MPKHPSHGDVDSPAAPDEYQRQKRLLHFGGVTMTIVGGLFVLLVFLAIALGPTFAALTTSAAITESTLQGLAAHSAVAWANYAVGAVSDMVLLPAVLFLYLALRRIDREVMLLATAFFVVYVFLDLAVTGLDFAGLITVSENYAANLATTQPSEIAVARYLHSVISISQPISSGALSVGILLSSFVLRQGALGKGVVYLGAAAGVVGLAYAASAALPGLAGLLGLSAILELLWFVVIGVRLYRSG